MTEPNDRERDLAQDLGDTGRVADIAQLLARYREELLSDADIVTQDAVNHAKAAREGDLRRFFKVLNLEPGECEPALAIEMDIKRLLEVERMWSDACAIARIHCPVNVGESHIREGIPRLAKRVTTLAAELDLAHAEAFKTRAIQTELELAQKMHDVAVKERDFERRANARLRADLKGFEEALGDADAGYRDADAKAKLAHSVIHDLAGAFARLVTAVDLFDLGRITREQLGAEAQASRAKFSAALDRLTEKPTSCQHPRALQVPPYYNGTSWCLDCGAVRGTGANGRNTKWRSPGDEDAKWEWEWGP